MGSSDASRNRRCERAVADVRAGHRIAQAIVERGLASPEGSAARNDAAVRSFRLALAIEGVVRRLEEGAAGGAAVHPRRRTVAQAAAWRLVCATWQFPKGTEPPLATDPGVVAELETLRGRHTRWAASFIQLLEDRPVGLLPNLRIDHRSFGELDAFDAARYVKILTRHYELGRGENPGSPSGSAL